MKIVYYKENIYIKISFEKHKIFEEYHADTIIIKYTFRFFLMLSIGFNRSVGNENI